MCKKYKFGIFYYWEILVRYIPLCSIFLAIIIKEQYSGLTKPFLYFMAILLSLCLLALFQTFKRFTGVVEIVLTELQVDVIYRNGKKDSIVFDKTTTVKFFDKFPEQKRIVIISEKDNKKFVFRPRLKGYNDFKSELRQIFNNLK